VSANRTSVGSKHDLRIREGGPLSGTWKMFAGVGALGLLGAGAGYASDPKRFAFSYLFAFFCFLTPALGALFFVFTQHLTKAGWSVTVRRTAEFFMAGLPVFTVLALPILLNISTLYPWVRHAAEHADAHAEHSSLQIFGLENAALAQDNAAGHEGDRNTAPHAVRTANATHGGAREHGALGAGSERDPALEQAEHEEHAKVLKHKSGYLNTTFFYIRAVFYFVVWTWLSLSFFRFSTEQDASRKHDATTKAQNLAPLAAILFAISLTFAAVDWIMALDPLWYSTMWGVQIFAGSVVSMYAVVILTTLSLKNNKLIGEQINVEHFHDLGKLQFGFLVFWAYVTFSQFFLIWYSNIPEETTFYNRRWHEMSGSWQGVSWALFFGHFILPFAVLLSRNVKRRLHVLPIGCIVILVMHFVELYWIVMPTVGPLAIHWIDVACFLGVGGAYLALVFRTMTRHSLIPIGDPRLPRALHFEQA
jgi:hypothetical protein